jgi:hypothetical protein
MGEEAALLISRNLGNLQVFADFSGEMIGDFR